ncbi:MAG: hypothetical protein ACTHQQ_05810 [Solirubrobacteraceae bacterium]
MAVVVNDGNSSVPTTHTAAVPTTAKIDPAVRIQFVDAGKPASFRRRQLDHAVRAISAEAVAVR